MERQEGELVEWTSLIILYLFVTMLRHQENMKF